MSSKLNNSTTSRVFSKWPRTRNLVYARILQVWPHLCSSPEVVPFLTCQGRQPMSQAQLHATICSGPPCPIPCPLRSVPRTSGLHFLPCTHTEVTPALFSHLPQSFLIRKCLIVYLLSNTHSLPSHYRGQLWD